MSLEVEGKVIKIMAEQSGDSRNGKWVKQEFVIETEDNFPKKICFSAWNDKTKALKGIKVGDSIKVSFEASSREFNDKWYTDLRAWKIDVSGAKQATQATAAPQDAPPPPSEEDFLPF